MINNYKKAVAIVTSAIMLINVDCHRDVYAYSNDTVYNIQQIDNQTSNFKKINEKNRDMAKLSYTKSRLSEKQKDLHKQMNKQLAQHTINQSTQSTSNKPVTDILQVQSVEQSSAIIKIDKPDPEYRGCKVIIASKDERELLERLVTGEAGDTYEGSLLVAQCIRDAIVYDNYKSISQLRRDLKYSGSTKMGISDNAKRAVADIFDNGKCAVKHRIMYFYAPDIVRSAWHETQDFILEINGHRYFDRADTYKRSDKSSVTICESTTPTESKESKENKESKESKENKEVTTPTEPTKVVEPEIVEPEIVEPEIVEPTEVVEPEIADAQNTIIEDNSLIAKYSDTTDETINKECIEEY